MITEVDDHYIDQDTVRSLQELGGDDDPMFLSSLVADYLSDSAANIDAIKRSIIEGDPSALGHYAHTVKGASLNIGAVKVGDVAKRLEQTAKGSDFSTVHLLIEQLEKVFSSTAEELRKLM